MDGNFVLSVDQLPQSNLRMVRKIELNNFICICNFDYKRFCRVYTADKNTSIKS